MLSRSDYQPNHNIYVLTRLVFCYVFAKQCFLLISLKVLRPYSHSHRAYLRVSCLPFCVSKTCTKGTRFYVPPNNTHLRFLPFLGSPFLVCMFWHTKRRTGDVCGCALRVVNSTHAPSPVLVPFEMSHMPHRAPLRGKCSFLMEHFKGQEGNDQGQGGNCLCWLCEVSGLELISQRAKIDLNCESVFAEQSAMSQNKSLWWYWQLIF